MKSNISGVLDLLDELEKMINNGNTGIFRTNVAINPEEALDIIGDIRIALPDDLKNAKQIVAEQKQIIYEARQEGQRIKNRVETQLRARIQNDEITKQARVQAKEILAQATAEAEKRVKEADAYAQKMKIGAQKYADKQLYDVEITLQELYKKIERDRSEIRKVGKGIPQK